MTIMNTVKKQLANLGLMLLTLVSLVFVHAQDIVPGTEVLLTDLSSETIVGHGQVEAGVLNLRLIDETGGFFLYFIFPDGQVATHQGQITQELIGVFTDAGDLLDFTTVLAARGGIQLNVIRTDGTNLNPSLPSNDGQLTQPGS